MKQFEVQLALEEVASQRRKWNAAWIDYDRAFNKVMARLIHEAVANRMSVEQVSKMSHVPRTRIRSMMRRLGLDPRTSPTLLAESAAKALQENAELLGIDPVDFDLTSPLAYLPMGRELRDRLQSEAVRGVKDVD